MADPLSITASVIAVVGAAEGVSKTIAKVKSIQNASNEALALINEVSDLRIILYDVESYVSQNARWSHSPPEQLDHMTTLLTRAKDQLLQLDKLIQYQLVKPESTDQKIKVSRREWARAKDVIKNFRRSLRDIRLNIVAQMVVLNSSYQSRIGLAIEEIRLLSSQVQAAQLHDRTTRQLDEHTTLLASILTSQGSLRDMLRLPAPIGEQSRVAIQSPLISVPNQSTTSAVLIQARRLTCTVGCRCACHKLRLFTSSHFLSSTLGRLFIGYAGIPLAIFQKCTNANCQARKNLQTSVNYVFPSWLLFGILSLNLIAAPNNISVSLTFTPIVSAGAEIFRLTALQDIDGLKTLFSKGLASPNDVDPFGQTPLRNAVVRSKLNSCRFLLQAGSDPHFESVGTSTAFTAAWNDIFEASKTASELNALKNLFPMNEGYLEDRQFSKLHTTVLGITSHNLMDQLALYNTVVNLDAVDSIQYTALMWAARRGSATDVEILLKAKANPNSIDPQGKSVLSIATFAPEPRCVKLLLEAGADPTHKSQLGHNALHVAAGNQDNRQVIDYLIHGGVDMNERDTYGATPLHQSAVMNYSISAQALLDHGAIIDALDNDGDSPLHQAIFSHADKVTQLLLSRGAAYIILDRFGFSILHFTAMSGGLRTIEILLAAKLSCVDPNVPNHDGKTALQIAQQRGMKEDGFVDKFKVLLDDISARKVSLQEQASQERRTNAAIRGRPRGFWTRWKPSMNKLQQLRSMLSSILLYWILGIGWAGFVYMLLLDKKGLSVPKDSLIESKD